MYSSRVLDQAIERRKVEFPDRPLIRISSTFFWHLSSDYDLVPIAALKDKADILRTKNLEAELNEVVYTDEISQVSPSLCALFGYSMFV